MSIESGGEKELTQQSVEEELLIEEAPKTQLQIRLKKGEESRILSGHSWVFSNEIAQVIGEAQSGSLGRVFAASGVFLGVGFYNPHSLIACRIFSRRPLPSVGTDFFYQKLSESLEYRKKLYPQRAPFYRLCFGESDGLPGLVIDRYGDVLVLQILSAGMEKLLPEIAEALKKLLNPSGIYLKNDHRSRFLEGLKAEEKIFFGAVPEKVTVDEFGLQFLTPIAGAQKTGFYFDQAENRVFLKPYFSEKTVLDLYCYSGAFGIAAAKAGAKSVMGFDSSESAIALARENAKLNQVSEVCVFEKGDAEERLNFLAENRLPTKPDMILLDPPSLVPSRKDLLRAQRAYVKLNSLAIRALPQRGLLATSTCSHHVTREIFMTILKEAAAKTKKSVRLLSLRGQALDHPILLAMPETEYLHFALLEIVD